MVIKSQKEEYYERKYIEIRRFGFFWTDKPIVEDGKKPKKLGRDDVIEKKKKVEGSNDEEQPNEKSNVDNFSFNPLMN
jgi:hypothetical protein